MTLMTIRKTTSPKLQLRLSLMISGKIHVLHSHLLSAGISLDTHSDFCCMQGTVGNTKEIEETSSLHQGLHSLIQQEQYMWQMRVKPEQRRHSALRLCSALRSESCRGCKEHFEVSRGMSSRFSLRKISSYTADNELSVGQGLNVFC